MPHLLSHTADVGLYYVYAGLALLAICTIWSWVIAAGRGVGWFLAVFFFSPLALLIFAFVESKAWKPILGMVAGVCILFWGVTGVEGGRASQREALNKLRTALGLEKKSADGEKEETLEPSAPASAETLEQRKDRIRAWQVSLQAKQAALKPNDPAAKAAFDREFAEYMAELDKVKAEAQKAKP
jgi:hypothetical protein